MEGGEHDSHVTVAASPEEKDEPRWPVPLCKQFKDIVNYGTEMPDIPVEDGTAGRDELFWGMHKKLQCLHFSLRIFEDSNKGGVVNDVIFTLPKTI